MSSQRQLIMNASNKKQISAYLVLISYFCQGIASLIYQVSWEQAMEKIVGMALPTIAIIVSIFLAGMAIGAFIFSKRWFNPQLSAQLYVLNQCLLFIYGLIFIGTEGLQFIGNLSVQNEQWLPFLYTARLFLIAFFLLLPAILIGAAFPLLLQLSGWRNLKINAQQLYFSNIAGSIIGSLLAGFFLLPNLGMAKSILVAALINLFAALLILVFSIPLGLKYSSESQLMADRQNIDKKWLYIIGAAAFFNMFLELLFIRFFTLFMGSSNCAYSIVLSVQLFALGCGAYWACVKSNQKDEMFFVMASRLYLCAGLWLLLQLFSWSQVSSLLEAISKIGQTALCLSPSLAYLAANLFVLILIMFVPCFCLGTILPFYFRFQEDHSQLAQLILPGQGQAYAINLFASLIGCLSAGIIIIPFLNLISNHAIYLAFVLSALLILFVGFWIYGTYTQKWEKIIPFAVLLLSISVALFAMPKPILSYLSDKGLQCLMFYKEGINSTVSVMQNPALNVVYLQTDGQVEAALPLNKNLPAPTSDETTQTLLGILPAMFCSVPEKNVFLLGYGSGITAHSILLNSQVKRLTVAELEPAVISASQCFDKYFPQTDERMQIRLTDGRSFLSMLDQFYNVIISQPGEPSRSSSAYLYTFEFWQLAKRRLLPGGVFCQWLPLYAIDKDNLFTLCRTFAAVFPNTFIFKPDRAGEIILLGLNSSSSEISSPVSLPQLKPTLSRLGFSDLNTLWATVRLEPASLRKWLTKGNLNSNLNLNRDDFPFVQYRLQALLNEGGNNIKLNIVQIFQR